jgi:hypothetical protein
MHGILSEDWVSRHHAFPVIRVSRPRLKVVVSPLPVRVWPLQMCLQTAALRSLSRWYRWCAQFDFGASWPKRGPINVVALTTGAPEPSVERAIRALLELRVDVHRHPRVGVADLGHHPFNVEPAMRWRARPPREFGKA